ncbi:hypothetical protein SIA70_13650 [Bacillus subtilis]|uniref:hypothetical protein n=1 Tax=Bacillus subtilis TaxID=1423 RepID=UPI0029C2052A|nr:hypothetical protein [Bacillus subtilis]MDX6157150.1 hypothetical protein [Bacillus subtilis]
MDQKDKAVYYYKKGQENLTQKENKVYEAKINIIMHFFRAMLELHSFPSRKE